MKRKIVVVTGSRAEYGLLYWLMKEIDQDNSLELQIVVTGMHLSPEFGLTYKVIESDGFRISEKIEMLLSSDTPVGITKSVGLATIGFADAYERLKPDLVVLLGDRYEILAAAQAALFAKIPIAHIHGGEATEGAIDESIRHAVTKMSHLHFVAAEEYRMRVIQMGENPKFVCNFGAPGLDNINKLVLLGRTELEKTLGFLLGELNFLVTYHPVTLNSNSSKLAMLELLSALDCFPKANIIFTKPNSDADSRIIIKMIDDYAHKWSERVHACTSLGQLRYLSAINQVDVVIGNSSSGLIEVPALKKPTVNIGQRQKGRLRANSVIDCAVNTESIVAAVKTALSVDFRQKLPNVVSHYGNGNASFRIKEFIKQVDLSALSTKKFFELPMGAINQNGG